jgi:thiamine-phosphate pyrophosphorylase
MRLLPRIYPITDTKLSGLSHLEQAEQLIEAGAKIIQIRDKSAASRILFEQVERIVSLAAPKGVQVIVNDRADIALMSGAAGVHLGQDDLPPQKAREFLGSEALIGFSTHSVEQAQRAACLPVDYIAIGPVFPTSTKADPDPVIGLKGVADVRAGIGKMPLVAIGGINIGNFRNVLSAGADSVAVIWGILSTGEPIKDSFERFMGSEHDLDHPTV